MEKENKMKILVLTSINEVESSIVYESIQREFEENKNLNILCFPLFAFMKAEADGKLYIPTYFAIIKAFNEDKKLRKALLDKTDTIIIGNLYKEKEKKILILLLHIIIMKMKCSILH